MNKHRPHFACGLLTGPARAAAAGHVKDDRDASGAFFLAGRQILHKQALQHHRGPAPRTDAELSASHSLVRPAKGRAKSSRIDSLNVVAVLTARDRLWRVHTLIRRFIFQNQTFAKAATRRPRATADVRVPAVFPG
jgi:hypothetical protein